MRRHKPSEKRGEQETSFFVSNIPDRPSKSEFRRIFMPFGRLSDIYSGGNKSKAGKKFGFIRFMGVKDVKALESKLNGTKCRMNMLDINVAKHEKKLPNNLRQHTKPMGSNNWVAGNGFVDNCSYAQVTGSNTAIRVI